MYRHTPVNEPSDQNAPKRKNDLQCIRPNTTDTLFPWTPSVRLMLRRKRGSFLDNFCRPDFLVDYLADFVQIWLNYSVESEFITSLFIYHIIPYIIPEFIYLNLLVAYFDKNRAFDVGNFYKIISTFFSKVSVQNWASRSTYRTQQFSCMSLCQTKRTKTKISHFCFPISVST